MALQRKPPELLPNVAAAVQTVIDTIAVEAEDAHAAAAQINGSMVRLAERLQTAQIEASAELEAMIAAKRQARRQQQAGERLDERIAKAVANRTKAPEAFPPPTDGIDF